MKNMRVLGIELKDYSVKEAMRMVDRFLKNAKVDTICFLSTDILVTAEDSPELKVWLQSMDLTVPISTEILYAANLASRQRLKEVENSSFYTAFIKKLSAEKRTVFILTEKEETIKASTEYLEKFAPGVQIVGAYAFESLTGDPDMIVNEINSTFPDVVFSRLPSPKQERFVYENKSKMNAKLWVAIKENFLVKEGKNSLKIRNLSTLIEKTIFRRTVSKYVNGREKGD
ncbi:MAG: WecB/TagA/CpsF family glycosyltransferase [Lachnospiraceae bacterium]